MAYIGAQPRLGNFQACDAITTSATTTFNLLVGGTAIFPQSAQHCLVSLNGVLQAPISSYTISGSTIIFAAALTTDDSIDFITILGDTLDLGTPSDSTVTTAKLNTAVLTGATDIGAAIADADLFLVDDGAGGTLRKTAASRIKTYVGGANTPAFSARISSSHAIADETTTDVVFNTEFFDVGSGYNTSNGIFTVPSGEGGKYFFSVNVIFNDGNGNTSDVMLFMHSTIGGSASQDQIARFEATSNATIHTQNELSYNAIIALSAGDAIKIQAHVDTNNSSGTTLQHGARNSVFSAFKIIE